MSESASSASSGFLYDVVLCSDINVKPPNRFFAASKLTVNVDFASLFTAATSTTKDMETLSLSNVLRMLLLKSPHTYCNTQLISSAWLYGRLFSTLPGGGAVGCSFIRDTIPHRAIQDVCGTSCRIRRAAYKLGSDLYTIYRPIVPVFPHNRFSSGSWSFLSLSTPSGSLWEFGIPTKHERELTVSATIESGPGSITGVRTLSYLRNLVRSLLARHF
ncbi:hypothetical protein DFH29DRAFT_333754 [Suillus ampliporus]|nr:hypothetical protein DFH29DRAFT_333754 [Suillus ampliporus]